MPKVSRQERSSKGIRCRIRDPIHTDWVFTLNNPVGEEVELLKTNVFIKEIIFQTECGQEGTRHLQGYLELVQAMTFDELKEGLQNQRIHVEPRTRSRAVAAGYCRKTDTRVEGWSYCTKGLITVGVGRGTRSDLKEIIDMIRGGCTEDDVWKEFPAQMIHGHRGIRQYILWAKKHQSRGKPTITILVGETGTGKSRQAQQDYPDAYWLTKGTSRPWYDGYAAEASIILDEFYSWLAYDELLRLFDRYPLQLQTKGGSVPCKAHIFCITSNVLPQHWYPGIRDKAALGRRIREWGEVIYFQNTPLGVVKKNITDEQVKELMGSHQDVILSPGEHPNNFFGSVGASPSGLPEPRDVPLADKGPRTWPQMSHEVTTMTPEWKQRSDDLERVCSRAAGGQG